ncbi:hypothetical protein DOJK_00671 [Patescibacteria group bacterium]|nr:hypothetical protein [Candidatus Dojkabacteria bacterium]CAG1020949.1 hypothetical protein DOJK_00671 [Patescibacteria group bacterium]
MKKYNDHLYCLDKITGIVYRAVGLTNDEKIIIYPKYIPSMGGDRGKQIVKYTGVKYPYESVKFVRNKEYWKSENVNLEFSEQFNTFVPTALKKNVEVFEGRKYLKARITSSNELSIKAKELIELFCTANKSLNTNDFGIDASMLVGLETNQSDIDLIVYSLEKYELVKETYKKLVEEEKLTKPISDREFFISRRSPYSPLMTEDEILTWESRKVSGLFNGTKFSILPKDLDQTDERTYTPTGQQIVIRFKLKKDIVLFDPGYIDLKTATDNIEIVWGPKNIDLSLLLTHRPIRFGTSLVKGDTIFASGDIYKINDTSTFALTQFSWDETFYKYETKFIMKIEHTRLDEVIPAFLSYI